MFPSGNRNNMSNAFKTDLTVEKLSEILKGVNPKAKILVIAHNYPQEFALCCGGGDGCTKENCDDFSFYCDKLCENEQESGG